MDSSSSSKDQFPSDGNKSTDEKPGDDKKAAASTGAGDKRAAKKAEPESENEEESTKLQRPKRPLSAYNLFFADEREKITTEQRQGIEQEDLIFPTEEEIAQHKATGKKTPPVLFQALAKCIGKRWKSLPAEKKKSYDERAKVEKQTYLEKLQKYKESVANDSAADEQKKPPPKKRRKKLLDEALEAARRKSYDEYDREAGLAPPPPAPGFAGGVTGTEERSILQQPLQPDLLRPWPASEAATPAASASNIMTNPGGILSAAAAAAAAAPGGSGGRQARGGAQEVQQPLVGGGLGQNLFTPSQASSILLGQGGGATMNNNNALLSGAAGSSLAGGGIPNQSSIFPLQPGHSGLTLPPEVNPALLNSASQQTSLFGSAPASNPPRDHVLEQTHLLLQQLQQQQQDDATRASHSLMGSDSGGLPPSTGGNNMAALSNLFNARSHVPQGFDMASVATLSDPQQQQQNSGMMLPNPLHQRETFGSSQQHISQQEHHLRGHAMMGPSSGAEAVSQQPRSQSGDRLAVEGKDDAEPQPPLPEWMKRNQGPL